MPIEVRPALETDIGAVVRLNGVVQDLHAHLSPDAFRSDWDASAFAEAWAKRIADKVGTVAVAERDGGIVGYVWFELVDRPEGLTHCARRSMYVHHLAVDDAARRHGIGRQLMAYVEAEARRQGIARIGLDTWAMNENALAFFRAHGYGAINVVLAKTI